MPRKPSKPRQELRQKAEQARRLASAVAGDAAAKKLLEYAKELEDRAAAPNADECGEINCWTRIPPPLSLFRTHRRSDQSSTGG